MTGQTNKSQWKDKLNTLLNSAQSELKRTTAIGIKLVSASQANSQLHEKLEELGKLAFSALEDKELQWHNPKVHDLVKEIQNLHATLEAYEEDVQQIKKGD